MAAVFDFECARCCRSPARYTIEYAHLLTNVEGVLAESFATLFPNFAADPASPSATLRALLPMLHSIPLVLGYFVVHQFGLGLLDASLIPSISWWVVFAAQFVSATSSAALRTRRHNNELKKSTRSTTPRPAASTAGPCRRRRSPRRTRPSLAATAGGPGG